MSRAENPEFSVESTPVIDHGQADGAFDSSAQTADLQSAPKMASDDTEWGPEKTPTHPEQQGLGVTQSFDDNAAALFQDIDDNETDYPVSSLLSSQNDSLTFENKGTVAAFQDADTGDQYHINQLPFVIGRSELCDLVLDDEATVALRQAELVDQFGRFVIRNLYDPVEPGTSGGIFVNGYRIEQVILENGDHVRIGDKNLVFRSSPDSVSLAQEALNKSEKKAPGIFHSFKRQWLLVFPLAVFTYAAYLIIGEFQAASTPPIVMDTVEETVPLEDVALFNEPKIRTGILIGDTHSQTNAFDQQSPLATSVEAQIAGQQLPLISESFDISRQSNQSAPSNASTQSSGSVPANMVTDGWPELAAPMVQNDLNAGWNDAIDADFAMLSGQEKPKPKQPPTPPVNVQPPSQAFPSFSANDQAMGAMKSQAQNNSKTIVQPQSQRGAATSTQSQSSPDIAMVHQPTNTSTQNPAWLEPMVGDQDQTMTSATNSTQHTDLIQEIDDPFLSTVSERLAALSRNQRSSSEQQPPLSQNAASRSQSQVMANIEPADQQTELRPEQSLLKATQGSNPSLQQNKTDLVSELIVGGSIEEKARNLVFNAELLYKEEGAQKVLALLKRYHDEPSVSSRVRGELNSEYVKYNRLYQAYLRGQKAFALGEKEAAFKQWATFLREEKKAIFTAKPSLYATEVRKIVAKEYIARAEAAEQRQSWSLAWKNWENALKFGADEIAKEHLHRIEKLAKNIFDKGVSLEDSDPNAASQHLVEVMAILPASHPLHDQAKSKVAWLNQWIN